jgi:hypothetical protein
MQQQSTTRPWKVKKGMLAPGRCLNMQDVLNKMFKEDVYLFLSHVAPNLLKIYVQKFSDTSRRHGNPTPRTLLIRSHNLPSVSKVSSICTFVLAKQVN